MRSLTQLFGGLERTRFEVELPRAAPKTMPAEHLALKPVPATAAEHQTPGAQPSTLLPPSTVSRLNVAASGPPPLLLRPQAMGGFCCHLYPCKWTFETHCIGSSQCVGSRSHVRKGAWEFAFWCLEPGGGGTPMMAIFCSRKQMRIYHIPGIRQEPRSTGEGHVESAGKPLQSHRQGPMAFSWALLWKERRSSAWTWEVIWRWHLWDLQLAQVQGKRGRRTQAACSGAGF